MANIKHVNSVVDREFRNTINQLIDATNAQGKSIQDLVAEGQLTEEQYAELLTTINSLVKSGNIDKSDLTPEFKDEIEGFNAQLAEKANESQVRKKSDPIGLNDAGSDLLTAIQGGTTVEVLSIPRDYSVTPVKTTFMDMVQTKNIFDSYWENGKLNTAGGEEVSPHQARTGFVAVKPNATYTVSFNGVTVESYNVNLFDSSKQQVRYVSSVSNKITFTTDSNVTFVRFQTYKNGANGVGLIPTSTQLELGSIATPHVQNKIPFLNKDYFPDKSLTPEKTTFFVQNRNLFNTVWVSGKINADGTEGIGTAFARTGYVKVSPDKHYTISFKGLTGVYYYIFYYDVNMAFVSGSAGNLATTQRFKTGVNVEHIRVMTYKEGAPLSGLIPSSTQLELGLVETDYIDPNIKQLDGKYIDTTIINNEIINNNVVLKRTQWTNDYVKGIAHRGYSAEAPEGTEPAYILAREKGFRYVEGDLQFTKDGVPVIYHDTNLSGKGIGTGTIADHTLAELKTLDFGAWFGSSFVGTKILTFEEWMKLCKRLNVKPYVDFKTALTDTQAKNLVSTAKKLGMLKHITWLGWWTVLDQIRLYDNKARIADTTSSKPTDLTNHVSRLTEDGNVVLNIEQSLVTKELADMCAENNIELECWIVNEESRLITLLDWNVTGITTDKLDVPWIMLQNV